MTFLTPPSLRLKTEIDDLSKSTSTNLHLGLIDEKDPYHWTGSFIGPVNTVYEDMVIPLEVDIHPEYPFIRPIIRFLEPWEIDHPIVQEGNGIIDLDLLVKLDPNCSSPAMSIFQSVLQIISFITSEKEKT